MQLLNIIRSKLYKLKPFLLNKTKIVVWSLILIVVSLFVGAIFQSQIDNYVEKYIFHKESEVVVTLNLIVRLPNEEFINISEIPSTDIAYSVDDFIAIRFNTDDLPLVEFNFDGELNFNHALQMAYARPLNYIDYNRTISQYNCLIYLFAQGYETNQSTPVIMSFDSKDPSDINYLEYFFIFKNTGNKEISNYKANICLNEGLIKKVEPQYSHNLISLSAPNCVEIRIENFSPGDEVKARFYADAPYYDSDFTPSFNSYDENGKISNVIFTENYIFFLPNCTFIPEFFDTIEILKE